VRLSVLLLRQSGRARKREAMMTKQEAANVIKTWIETSSPFAAEVVSITADEEGAWVGVVECSEVLWRQKVNPEGTVSDPMWMD
jgi:hypothetical protein